MTSETKGEKAVEIFDLVIRSKTLPAQIEKLVPLSFIGQTAVNFYRDKIKLMDRLDITEEQRKATLKDGQEAGELLLDIETRIGEIAAKEERVSKTASISSEPIGSDDKKIIKGRFIPSGEPPKHERLGIPKHKMSDAQKIAKHPEIVEKIKAKARENEDIPTKTAVLAEIRYQKEKKRREFVEKENKKSKSVMKKDEINYIISLQQVINILPAKPPKEWSEPGLQQAEKLAKLIIKRLGVFNNV